MSAINLADKLPPSNFFSDSDQRPLPPGIWHYTTLEGLLGIVRSNQIWATNFKYLNDVTEALQIFSFVSKRVESLAASNQHISSLDVTKFMEIAKTEKPIPVYVTSFSEARDSLSQWRAYSGSNGICIGFRSAALPAIWIADPQGGPSEKKMSRMRKVRYVPKLDDSALDSDIKELLEYGAKQKLNYREDFLAVVLNLTSAFFKHQAFADEKEWRMCVYPDQMYGQMCFQRFRSGRSMLIPYVSAELNLDKERNERIAGSYISEVIIGPSANMGLTQEAVKQLLDAEGHKDVPVELSDIPYRDW